jgi:pimeloyl-ACP methyl ester carboxylesterase
MASYIERVSGQAINLLAAVAPSMAGRLAFRKFSTIGASTPTSDKQRRLFEMAQPQMQQARKILLPVPAGEVATHDFPPIGAPNGKRYLVIHGWGSRIDYLQALITSLRQSGAAVVGLDMPGHGGSSGRILTVPLAMEAIDAVWHHFGSFDAVIGHSFGGYVAAMAAAAPAGWVRRRTPSRLVLIGAPVAAEPMFDEFEAALHLSPRARRALDDAVEAIAGKPVAFFAADAMLATVPELSVLVLHAEDDKEVAAAEALRFSGAGAHVRLQWMNGLGHRRIVSSPATAAKIAEFLTDDVARRA